MKLQYFLCTLLAAAATLFTACDSVDENDRFSTNPITVQAKKNVLIEDFTGQKCVNCPNASKEITQLQGIYGAHRLIAVAIHGGSNGVSDTNPNGLATADGDAYHKQLDIKSYPIGLVDRTGGLKPYMEWSACVLDRFKVEPKAAIQVTTATISEGQLQVEAQVQAHEAVSGQLQLWITESNLVRTQYMPDGSRDNNYVHNHVFRGSVNAFAGDALSLTADETQTVTYTCPVSEKWNTDNLAIVAIFSNATDGVVQVVDQEVK